MADIAIFRINYKSDFIITLQCDVGWQTPFCIKFWTDSPARNYFVGWDGKEFINCKVDETDASKLIVLFDDHNLPVGQLKMQMAWHTTIADFPYAKFDEVMNQMDVVTTVEGEEKHVELALNGETAPEIAFSLPAYANEAQRIANEQQRIANEQQRIANEEQRIAAEQTRQQNEQQRIANEEARVAEFARLKRESEQATEDANDAAVLATTAADLASAKAQLAQDAATLANQKAQLAADKAALADSAATLATQKAQLAQEKATYAQTQGDYAKEQGDYAKAQGDTAQADHVRAEADHTTAASDHETAASDHTRAESDHAAVEVYVDSLGAFDISAYHATGGVLAKYADLTAALGTNGANIPDALRKGGMSVKFVQSSDNKYVQFRLMSDTFNTTPANWQGVDEEPTAGSNNLVESGGVGLSLGCYVAEIDVQTTASVRAILEIQFERAPIELIVEVLENTASYSENVWMGIKISNSYVNFESRHQIYQNVFYYKETRTDYLSEKVGTLYLRKVSQAGNLKLRVYTNNGNAISVYRLNNLEATAKNSISRLNVLEPKVNSTVSKLNVLEPKVDDIVFHLPKSSEPQIQTKGEYALRNTQLTVGTRILNGVVRDSTYAGSLITGIIPISNTERYFLKTAIRNAFDGVAYYDNIAASVDDYIGNDIFHTDSSTEVVVEHELTIPSNAVCMRLATFNKDTAFEIKTLSSYGTNNIASEDYVQEQLEEYVPSAEYIDSLIDAKTEPIEEDIDYLYGVVSAGDTPPELAVRYVPIIQLFLGTDVLDVSNVTYDSNFWSVVNGLPKYLGGSGGGQTKTFKFNATTVNEARYLCDIVTLTQDSAYENLFYLRIGNGPLIDTYNGGRTTFGGLVSDGGCFEIVPYGVKAFDVTSITLKPLLNSEEAQGYTETRNLPVKNVDCGNSNRTLIDGKWNVAIGPTEETMTKNVSGSRSIAIGYDALKNWKYGLQNVAIGTFALSLLEEGNHNIAIGSDSMYQCKKAQDNVAIGRGALAALGEYTEMLNNVAVGYASMGTQHSSSRDSVSIGYKSNLYGAAYSVFIGSNCKTTSANKNIVNAIAIGYNVEATKSNQCVLGNTSVTEFVLGSKKLVFNQDGTVSWTNL